MAQTMRAKSSQSYQTARALSSAVWPRCQMHPRALCSSQRCTDKAASIPSLRKSPLSRRSRVWRSGSTETMARGPGAVFPWLPAHLPRTAGCEICPGLQQPNSKASYDAKPHTSLHFLLYSQSCLQVPSSASHFPHHLPALELLCRVIPVRTLEAINCRAGGFFSKQLVKIHFPCHGSELTETPST